MSTSRSDDEGPSSKVPLLVQEEEFHKHKEQHPGSANLGETAVDIFENNLIKSKKQDLVQKPRPLNLADNYEIVGGIPAFVWRRSEDYDSPGWMFVFSNDGTHVLVKEHTCQISVYDVTDSFFLVARGTDIGQPVIKKAAFWKHTNDRLVIAYSGKIGLYSIIRGHTSLAETYTEGEKSAGKLELLIEHEVVVLGLQDDTVRFNTTSFETCTWICAWDFRNFYTIHICCLDEEKEEGFRKIEIRDSFNIMPSITYISDTQKALISAVTKSRAPHLSTMMVWKNLDFSQSVKENESIIIKGHRLNWTQDGEHFCVLEVEGLDTLHLKIYSVSGLSTNKNDPLWMNSYDGVDLKLDVSFLQLPSDQHEVDGIIVKDMPLVGILAPWKKRITFTLCDFLNNRIIKELDLSMKKIDLAHTTAVEFCVSPDMRWIVLGSKSTRTVGLFCFDSGALVWQQNFATSVLKKLTYSLIRFDPMSSKLIIDAHKTLYAFAPACFRQNCRINYECPVHDMDLDSLTSFLNLDPKYQRMVSKRILWNTLELKKGPLELSGAVKKLDVAVSCRSGNISILVHTVKKPLILTGQWKPVVVEWYKMCYLDDVSHYHTTDNVKRVQIDTYCHVVEHKEKNCFHWIFMYFDMEKELDSIVLFNLKDGINGLFIDPTVEGNQDLVHFSNEGGVYIKQKDNSSIVSIIRARGVLIIDLNLRAVLHDVQYKVYLTPWFGHGSKFHPSSYNVSNDGTTILIGWDYRNEKVVSLTSHTIEQRSNELRKGFSSYRIARPLCHTFENIVSLELDENKSKVVAVVAYNSRNHQIKKYTRAYWNNQVRRAIDMGNASSQCIQDFVIDHSTGCIWMLVLQINDNFNNKMFLIPFNTYTMEDCLTSLYMQDYPEKAVITNELSELMLKHGISTITMPFNAKSNFNVAVDHRDGPLVLQLLDSSCQEGLSLRSIWKQCWRGEGPDGFLMRVIQDKDEVFMKDLINLMEKKYIPFEDNALIMKGCFKKLWLEYRMLVEPLLTKGNLVWTIGKVNVPSEILHNSIYFKARVGTSKSISEWLNAIREETLELHWKSKNKYFKEIEKKCSPMREKAFLQFFCIKDICKIGLRGILRFLLMQQAPSYIYKTTIVKWVLIWKWENIWKRRCEIELAFYTTFSLVFSVYAICIAYVGRDLKTTLWAKIFLSILLVALMLLAYISLRKECIQIKTYIEDGKILFPDDRYWGFKKYTQSAWNMLEITTYILLLTVIPWLHLLGFFSPSWTMYLLSVVAFGVLMLWAKFWYYGQAFQQTGALVLMIENVVKDCAYFLVLALLILVGFSLSLFVLFQYHLNEQSQAIREEDDDDEIEAQIRESFDTPVKAVLTLFYAMVGAFEPEVYSKCGPLATLVTMFFVVYLALEMIVLLNMLIAIMGDTFDRVKDTEEEQVLMGRARFIDACEASLTTKQIEDIESNAQSYLYVLASSDKVQDQEVISWRGRVKTIEERIRQRIVEAWKEVGEEIKTSREVARQDAQLLRHDVKRQVQKVQQDMQQQIQDVSRKLEDISSFLMQSGNT